jgi:hypothetical protein
VWVPPVDPSCVHEARSVGRVPRAAQHAGVGRIERRAIIDERNDVVERQVTRRVRRMLGTIARADVAVLADVAGDHPLGQAYPSRVRVDVMVGTDARQPRVLAAPTPRSARDDAADRAELHPRRAGDLAARLTLVTLDCRPLDIAASVGRVSAAVHPPAVLRLRDQPAWAAHLWPVAESVATRATGVEAESARKVMRQEGCYPSAPRFTGYSPPSRSRSAAE